MPLFTYKNPSLFKPISPFTSVSRNNPLYSPKISPFNPTIPYIPKQSTSSYHPFPMNRIYSLYSDS